MGISSTIIKPWDCVLAFGIPTSQNSFHEAVQHPYREYANFYSRWEEYDTLFVKHVTKAENIMCQLKVNIKHDVTLQDFGDLFSQEFHVVTLFSHWDDNSVEFADGMATIQDIVTYIPVQFSGIIDLCICHPKCLRDAIKQRNRRCLVRFTQQKASPTHWLRFYQVLFNYLNHKDITYLRALEDVVKEFQMQVFS